MSFQALLARWSAARPSLRDLPAGVGLGGAAGVAAAAFAAGVGATLVAVQYFRNDEPAPRREEDMRYEEDMKARFEDWVKEYNRTYRDEEEKAMQFQLFKAAVKRIESQPPAYQKMLQPGYFADRKDKERPSGRSSLLSRFW